MDGGHDGALEHHERGGGEDAEEHAHQQVAPEGDGRLVRHASLSVGAHLRKTGQHASVCTPIQYGGASGNVIELLPRKSNPSTERCVLSVARF